MKRPKLVSFAVLLAAVAQLGAQSTITLREYWSGANIDNATSSDSSFLARNPGYVLVRDTGRIIPPTATPPLDTSPLHTWWSPSRREYHTTTDSNWHGGPGQTRAPDYRWVRLEGHLYSRAAAGTVVVESFWSASRSDWFATSNPIHKGRNSIPPDYRTMRREGFVLPTERADNPPLAASAFHHNTMNPTQLSPRKLVVIMQQFNDSRFTQMTRSDVHDMFFGPAPPNVVEYAKQNSFGMFRWTDGGVWGPFTPQDDPDTTADESLYFNTHFLTSPNILYLSLKSRLDKTIASEGGGGGAVNCNRDGVGHWERFGLVDLNGGTLRPLDLVAFKTLNGHYLRLNTSSQLMDAVPTTFNAPTTRFLVRRADGRSDAITGTTGITLQCIWNSKYVTATNGGGSTVRISASSPGADGVFTLTREQIDDVRVMRGLLAQANRSGLDVQALDLDRDGTVEDDEVDIVLLDAVHQTSPSIRGGQTRRFGADRIPGVAVTVSGEVSGVGQRTGFATMAHELVHQLQEPPTDLYGSNGLNSKLSLMGPTISRTNNDPQIFRLDAWHRMRLGWTFPRLVDVTDYGGSATLRVPGPSIFDTTTWPILLYHPGKYDLETKQGEFFMLEYRTPGVSTYDQDVAGSGLAIWHCKTDANGHYLTIPPVGQTQCSGNTGIACDSTINHFGAPTGVRGGSVVWDAADGLAQLKWYDGTSASLRVRVSPHASGDEFVYVQWSGDGRLPARLDFTDVSRGRPQDVVTIWGEFTTERDGNNVWLTDSGGRAIPAQTLAFDAERVSFKVPGTRSSSPTPGVYTLHVGEYATTNYGNRLPFRIDPYAGIVSPTQNEAADGNSSSNYPFAPAGGATRYQQGHGDLRGSARTIRSMSFRRDGLVSAAGGARSVDVEVFMGHTEFDRMSWDMEQNYVTPRTQVVDRRTITLPDLGGRPASSPAGFDITIPFDTPFAYDGSHDLCWDIVVHAAPAGDYRLDAVDSANSYDRGRALSGGCTATAQSNPMQLVSRFLDDAGMLRLHHYVRAAPRSASGVVHIGFTDPMLPVPGMCGMLRTDATVTMAMPPTDAGGRTPIVVTPMINDPAWTGLQVFGQAAFLDPGRPDAIPISLSNGIRNTIPAPNPRYSRRVSRYYRAEVTGRNAEVEEWGDGLVVRFQ